MEIINVESRSKAHKVILTAEFATSPAGEVIPEIESPERIALALEYWNANQEQEFLAHGYFFCIGALCIRSTDSAEALLSIKAVQALCSVSF
jgi:hypothetical protein